LPVTAELKVLVRIRKVSFFVGTASASLHRIRQRFLLYIKIKEMQETFPVKIAATFKSRMSSQAKACGYRLRIFLQVLSLADTIFCAKVGCQSKLCELE